MDRIEHMFGSRVAAAKVDRQEAVEAELAELCGMANAIHGRMVELVGEALDEQLWDGQGIHSPEHWLGWKTSMTAASVKAVVALARRRRELPLTTAALAEGSLSLAQAAPIARHVPGSWEASVMDFAPHATVSQLQRSLSRYGFDPDPQPAPDPDAGPDEPAKPTKTTPIADRREWAMGQHDDGSWWLRGRLPADEGAVVAEAIKAARDDLYRQACKGLPEGAPRPKVTLVDGLLAVAEASLRAGQATFPTSDRYRIYTHLEAGPEGDNQLSLHLGHALPDHLRRLHTCDATTVPVLERDGTPVNLGREQHIVPRRIRRLIEHRDRGCAVPGCPATRGLDIHHIIHWEDGGPTDTHNLVALCRRHHRLHHLERLQIWGNADHPDHPDGIRFADHHGRHLEPTGTPASPDLDQGIQPAVARAGIAVEPYTHPSGERLDPSALFFRQDADWTPPPDPADPAEPANPPQSWPPNQPAEPSAADATSQTTDPTRAGPEAA
jgi:hypothetical protein